MKRIGAIIAAAVAILIGIQQIPGESTKTAFDFTTSGNDRVLLMAVAYAPSGDRAVASIECNGVALTKTGITGSISTDMNIELWMQIAPEIGTLPVTVTMSEDCDALVIPLCVTDADQTSPIAGEKIVVGEGVANVHDHKDGGDATLILVFSKPKENTLSTPEGFTDLQPETPGTADFLASAYLDDDGSQNEIAIDFSGAVDFASFILGVTLAP